MKLTGTLSAAILALTLGVGVPALAQQDQHDQQEERKDQPAKDTEKTEEKAQPEKSAKPEEKNARQDENKKPEEKNANASKPAQKNEHASGRIPEDRFRANFGREHSFHVNQADYQRDRRFQYGGYWFGFAQPWPANWLYTQEVYVIEIDGVYYLCNASYPGVNVTLNVTL